MNFNLILIFSLVGFLVSFHIWNKKKHKEKLVCIVGKNCEAVVRSKYRKTFGIDNTIMGMTYYFIMIILTSFQVFSEIFISGTIILWETIITGGATIFSLSLIFIQLRVIKEWCEYCLISSLMSILIFLTIILTL